MKLFNKFNWISAVDDAYEEQLVALQEKMTEFYAHDEHYFSEIDFTAGNWEDSPEYRFIIDYARQSQDMLEIGCGRSNILSVEPQFAAKYTGVDFSNEVLMDNEVRFPAAKFKRFIDARQFPVGDKQYDLMFSVFVLEHTVYPHKFLEECLRVVSPGGYIILLFPNFVGRGNMTSQKVGFGPGSGREKLKKGKIVDFLITVIENRIIMPGLMRTIERKAKESPQFMINTQPICFEQQFYPDTDAIYITNPQEVISFLSTKTTRIKLEEDLEDHLNKRQVSLLVLKKNSN